MRLPHGDDEGPRRHEAEQEGEENGGDDEAAHEVEGLAVREGGGGAQPAHAALLDPDDLLHEALDLLEERIAGRELEPHRLLDLPVANQVRHVGHRGHDLALGSTDALDDLDTSTGGVADHPDIGLALARWSFLFQIE